jgi:leukotriene-A4 hydrolase
MDDTLDLKANSQDISTYSNFHQICQKHIKIDALIDFKTLSVRGTVHITFKVISPNDESRVVLDCKHVKISGVRNTQTGKDLKWTLYEDNPDKMALGTPLVILLESDMVDTFTVSIDFCATETDATQWLAPHQTMSKKYPFMFTQCEAILCRTLIPCQDTPSAKVTVEANLTVEKPLRALYSGIEVRSFESGDNLVTYEYVQNIPVPTYLIAIACGELEYGKLSERCGIFTEVGLKDKAVWEFENTEEYLKTAENYLTPYQWGVYNILVLPFAFPYGGMENPCLTFVTPALIAGDRSMTNVIAHEIAHSWTGNLVTNKDWANFWMNEGFTTFMERKICELMYGEEMSNLEARVGQDELKAAIETIGVEHNYTSLAPDFSNVDPDDGFSVVPYEKGYTFIYYLETLVGKENFQTILRKYINTFALKSISHQDFRKLFEEEVKNIYGANAENEILSKIDWDSWIKTKGQPIQTFQFSKKIKINVY